MSPLIFFAFCPLTGFPRVSGDEPYKTVLVTVPRQFSPRERG